MNDDNGVLYWIFAALVVATVLPLTAFPTLAGYVVSLAVYSVLLGYAIADGHRTLRMDMVSFSLLCVVWLVFIWNVAGTSDLSNFAGSIRRVPLFVGILAINVYYVPTLVGREQFCHVLSRLGALFVVMGLPTLIGLEVGVGVLGIRSYENINHVLLVVGVEVPVLTSLFIDSNFLGEFLMLATIASLNDLHRDETAIGPVFAGINVLGIYLTQSRTAFVATTVGVGIYVAYRVFQRRQFHIATITASIAGLSLSLFVFRIVPAPSFVPTFDLTGRLELWRASVEAITNRPLFGYGPGQTEAYIRPFLHPELKGKAPHNSYLRVFLTNGIVGGVAYLLFVVWTVTKTTFGVNSPADALILAMVVASAIDQVFNGFSLLGISSPSVLASIAFGYAITQVVVGTPNRVTSEGTQ